MSKNVAFPPEKRKRLVRIQAKILWAFKGI